MSEHREPLVGTREVSNYLGIPETTLAQWRFKRCGPRGYKVGRHVKYRLSEVDAWLDARADHERTA